MDTVFLCIGVSLVILAGGGTLAFAMGFAAGATWATFKPTVKKE